MTHQPDDLHILEHLNELERHGIAASDMDSIAALRKIQEVRVGLENMLNSINEVEQYLLNRTHSLG